MNESWPDQHCKHCDPDCMGHLNPGWHKFDMGSLAWTDDYGCPLCVHAELLREMADEADLRAEAYAALRDAANRIEAGDHLR